jgi:hypothetical protein
MGVGKHVIGGGPISELVGIVALLLIGCNGGGGGGDEEEEEEESSKEAWRSAPEENQNLNHVTMRSDPIGSLRRKRFIKQETIYHISYHIRRIFTENFLYIHHLNGCEKKYKYEV